MTPGGGISPAELVYGGTLRPASYDIILAGGGPGVNLTGRLAGRKVTSALLAYSNWHVQDVRVELTPSQSKALIDFAQTVIDGGHIS